MAPDRGHASFDFQFAGTIRMIAIGNTQGVQINSDLMTEFHGSKRLRCDRNGLRSRPSRCTARSSMTTQDARYVRPRMFTRMYERVAQRRARATAASLEQECSQHVEHGIRTFMDQYIAALEARIHAALRDHVRGLSAEQRIALDQIRFRTEKDHLVVARGAAHWSPVIERDLHQRDLACQWSFLRGP